MKPTDKPMDVFAGIRRALAVQNATKFMPPGATEQDKANAVNAAIKEAEKPVTIPTVPTEPNKED